MAKRRAPDELDEAVDTIMTAPPPRLPSYAPEMAALLRTAADLRQLPRATFKAQLRSQLLEAAAAAARTRAYRPLMTEADIYARLEEIAGGPSFDAHDLRAALRDLPELSMCFLGSLNECTIGVSRLVTSAHWERHPAADELLHILEGEVDITTLTNQGPVQTNVRAGSIFICPQGLWHRVQPRVPSTLLFATPGEGTESSTETIPPTRTAEADPAARPPLSAHDIGAALRSVQPLTITGETTAAEADAAFRELLTFNRCSVNVGHFSGRSPWERHPRGDELLHILDGEVDITVLTDDGPIERTVSAGSIFLCPQGLWHRQYSAHGVTGFYATPTPSEISWAEDPRATT